MVKSQLNVFAVAIRNKMAEELITVLVRRTLIFENVSVRIKSPAKNPYAAATPADSVGLNIPVSIPPIMIKGIVRGMMAVLQMVINSLKDILSSRLG
jgi:hypothetical protein